MPWLLLTTLLLSLAGSVAIAADQFQIKVAFIYNFARLTDWPDGNWHPSNNGEFDICVVGETRIKAKAAALNNKEAHGQPIVIRALNEADNLAGCQIVFIGKISRTQARDVLAALAGKPVLTVSEMDGFTRMGGMVRFLLTAEGTVGFEVNVGVVKGAQLEMSSRVLRLATISKN